MSASLYFLSNPPLNVSYILRSMTYMIEYISLNDRTVSNKVVKYYFK